MSYKAIVIDNLLICKWAKFELEDCNIMAQEIASIYQKQQKPAFIVNMMSDVTAIPNVEFRHQSIAFMKNSKDYFQKMILVIPGEGLKHSIARTAASTTILISSERGKLAIAESLEEAIKEHIGKLSKPISEIMHLAEKNNLLTTS